MRGRAGRRVGDLRRHHGAGEVQAKRYVLVGSEIQSLLDAMGFDPYLGFYHQIDYGRPSLALDLLEEFRAPLVDRLSLRLLNLGILAVDDFTRTPEGEWSWRERPSSATSLPIRSSSPRRSHFRKEAGVSATSSAAKPSASPAPSPKASPTCPSTYPIDRNDFLSRGSQQNRAVPCPTG